MTRSLSPRSLQRRLAALAALSLATASYGEAADFDCKFQISGKSFDLNPLAQVFTNNSDYNNGVSTSKMTYSLSICSPLPRDGNLEDRDQCPEGSRACLTTINVKDGQPDRVTGVIPIAGGIGELSPSTSYVTGTKGVRDRLQVGLHAGSYLDRTRWANLTFFCDSNTESLEPTSWRYYRTETEGVMSVEWANKFGCPLNAPPGAPESGGASSGSGIIGGFFSTFFLFLFILLVSYFVLGAYYQYSQFGARGWDLLPNRAFWADVPYVLRDLFRGTGRNTGGYSSL